MKEETVMWNKILQGAAAVAFGALAAAGFSGLRVLVSESLGDIIEHQETSAAIPPEISPGGVFSVRQAYLKRIDCPGIWAYYMLLPGEAGWQEIRSGPTGANPVGEYTFVHQILVPSSAKPGGAAWREVITGLCPGYSTISRSSVVNFTISGN